MSNYDEKIRKSTQNEPKTKQKPSENEQETAQEDTGRTETTECKSTNYAHKDPTTAHHKPMQITATTEQNKIEQNKVKQNINSSNTDKQLNQLNYLLKQAFENKSWLEPLLMRARLSPEYIENPEPLAELLKNHICLYDKQNEIHSVEELRRYIANILAPGSISHTDITRQLKALCKEAGRNNPYRHETIDALTGQRTVQGKIIPANAPPRPNDNTYWSHELNSWV